MNHPWLIGAAIFIALVAVLLRSMHAVTFDDDEVDEDGERDSVEPCPLDSDCGDNEGGGCGRYSQCVKDFEI